MMMLLFSARTIIALSLVNGIIILLSSRCASASVTLPNAFLHCLTTVSIRSTPLPPSPLLPWPWCHRATTKTIVVSSTPSSRKNDVYIAFPGGGLFFYWQAGVIAYLQQEGYNLSDSFLSGASAGALSATLAKMNVCPLRATELALSLSDDADVWERPLGLQGVWGNLIYEWLNQLVPEDAEERLKKGGELHILLTPIPSLGKRRVSQFDNREDLIQANMASVHLPWFLDGKFTSNFRGKPHIDGSFLARPSDYFDYGPNKRLPPILIDFKRDPLMKERAIELIKVVSKQTIWDVLERGMAYGKIMDAQGEFHSLPRGVN